MDDLIILGAGGHARSITDTINCGGEYRIAGYVIGKDESINNSEYYIMGSDDDLENIYQSGIHNAALGIGFLGKSDLREKLYKRLKSIGFFLPVIKDSSAVISASAEVKEGVFIGKNVVINCCTIVGTGSIINSGAIVEHDCKVGDFSHISVGAVLCGNVTIGSSSLIGANATIIQGLSIGNACVIGAGTIITKNVEDYYMVYKNYKKYIGKRLLEN